MFRTSVREKRTPMPNDDDRWTLQIRRMSHHEGQLVSFFALVCSSTGSVTGSIESRGPACSELLALLQMLSPRVTVRDCSKHLPR